MPDDGENLRGLERLARADDVLDQRPSAGAMQHFRKVGTHARPLARGENDDGGVGRGHCGVLSLPLHAFAIGEFIDISALKR